MNAIWTLAGLTLKEAFRRRTFLAAVLITCLFLLVWLIPSLSPSGGVMSAVVQAGIMQLGLGMMRFFTALMGITLAAGAISGEIDRGTHYVILARPLARFQLLLGKWLGIVGACLCLYLFWGILVALNAQVAQHGKTGPFSQAASIGFLYPLVFTTLTLCYSTFAPPMLCSALGMVSLVIGWSEGMMRELGEFYAAQNLGSADTLFRAADVAGVISPIARIARASATALGLDRMTERLGDMMTGSFGEGLETTPWDFWWPMAHVALVLALAIALLRRRDL